LVLDLDGEVLKFHQQWEEQAQREKLNRTRFAQRALKPEEVQRELEAADAVLGDPDAVREFFLTAAQRLNLTVTPQKQPGVYQVSVGAEATATLPEALRLALPASKSGRWLISFDSPTPPGAEYVGRNHRFVAALAHFLLEEALSAGENPLICRCGALRSRAVAELTTLLLLRVRYLLELSQNQPLLGEEVLVLGGVGLERGEAQWLETATAWQLLAKAKPDANLPLAEKQELVEHLLACLGPWPETGENWGTGHPLQQAVRERIGQRASELEAAHRRIRQAVSLQVRGLQVKPQFPPDLLGLLVLQPLVGGQK
jgi:hypothetical protein